MKAPCLGCSDRTAACHDSCERYADFVRWRHGAEKYIGEGKEFAAYSKSKSYQYRESRIRRSKRIGGKQ